MRNYYEVILCYPFVRAMILYRVSHYLFLNKIEILPRLISEIVHSDTGIDIHPGATIGNKFFIDQGTGIVIGETAIIGDNVTLYQGVTLGTYSFKSANTKRHPTICENVTVYANATILGGDTVIGSNSIIGSNAWISCSIKSNSKVKANEVIERNTT